MSELQSNGDSSSTPKQPQPEAGQRPQFMVHFIVSFRQVCMVTAALPMVTLFMCFVSAYIYQLDDIHETHCRVYNVIPSISAITGVSPQRYFWRICIALHIGPRFIIAFCYKSFYMNEMKCLKAPSHKESIRMLIQLVFWLHFIEISALCGVTYISNRENYPLHEKIFIIFMTCSLCHMLATIKLNQKLQPFGPRSQTEAISLKWKNILFWTSIAATVGLLVFFVKHRFFCHDMAFSWFAFCEYIIATANMAFHCTTMLDFPNEHFLIAKGATHLKTHQPVGLKVD